MRVIEEADGDPEIIAGAVHHAAAAGLVTPADVQLIESFLAGGLAARELEPETVEEAAEDGGLSVRRARISDQLPEFMQVAGIQAAAFGDTVVTADGEIDVDDDDQWERLTHELKHVEDHGTGSTAIHFDVGEGPEEGGARSAGRRSRGRRRRRRRRRDAAAALTMTDRQRIVQQHQDQLDRIEGWLSLGVFDWACTASDARQAFEMFARMAPTTRIVLLSEMNARDSDYLGRLCTHSEPSVRRQYPATYMAALVAREDWDTIRQMLADRPSEHGFTQSQGPALSYALRRVPREMFTQLGRRRTSGADTVEMWLEMTPAPVGPERLQQYSASRADAQDAQRARQERRREEARRRRAADEAMRDPQFAARIARIQDLLDYEIFDWAITDGDAREVLRLFQQIANDPEQIRLTVHVMDRGPFMDRFMDNLSSTDRWGANRRLFLNVIAARSPERNIPFVRELLDTNILDWAVTDEDARMAFRIVQTMPRDVQTEFQELDGGRWWESMEGNLSDADANDRDMNLYQNQEESQQLKLSYREHCGEWNDARLRQRTEMLLRQGEVDFVEESLRAAGVNSADHPFLRQFGVATADCERNERAYTDWRNNRMQVVDETSGWDRFLQVMNAAGTAIGAGIGELTGQGTGESTIDLQALMEMLGGTVGGATIAGRGDNEEANQLNLQFDFAQGLIVGDIPQLMLQGYTAISDGGQLQIGGTELSGLQVELKWATEAAPEAYIDVRLERATIRDLWQVGMDSMATVARMHMQGLHVRGEAPEGQRPGNARDGVPILMDQLMDTMTQLMGAVQLDSPEPEELATSMTESLTGAASMQVEVAGLRLVGVGMSDGTHVGDVRVADVEVDTSRQRRSEVLTQEIAQLRQAEEPDEARLGQLEEELAAVQQAEARLDALLERQRDPEITLQQFERDELQTLQAQLYQATTEFQVGRIIVTDAETEQYSASEVTVQGVQGTSRSRRSGADSSEQLTEVDATVSGVLARDIHDAGTHRLGRYEARLTELRSAIDEGRATPESTALYERLTTEVQGVHRMIRERDELRLARRSRDPRLAELNRQLEPWLSRSGGTDVEILALSGGQTGGPALSVHADSHGGMQAQVASMTAAGIRRDGQTIDSVTAQGVSVDAQGDANADPNQDLMDRLTSASIGADQLQVQGLMMQSRLSETLQQELEALQERRALSTGESGEVGRALTAAERSRLTELPERIQQARQAEARIAEIGEAEQRGEMTPEMQSERETLLATYGERYTQVESITARGVTAGITPGEQRMTFGVQGDGEEAGLEVTGIEQGGVGPGGERQATRHIDRVAAQSIDGELTTDGDVDDVLGMQQGTNQYGAQIHARGLDVEGYEAGQEGEAGHQRVDRIHADALDVGYQSQATGEDGQTVDGRLDMQLTGGEVSGVHMQSGSRIASLREERGTLQALTSGGRELTERQQARLAEIDAQIAEYDRLSEQAAGRGRRARRAQRTLADEWDATSTTDVGRVAIEDLSLRADGVGNVMDDQWDDQAYEHAAVSGESHGAIRVEDYRGESHGRRTTTTTMESAELRGTRFAGRDLLSSEERQLSLEVDELEAGRTRAGSAGFGRARGRGLQVGLQGDDATIHADRLDIGGGHSGGNSAGHIGLSGVDASITDMSDARRRRVSGSAAGIGISNGRSRSADMDARVRRLRGRRASFAMSQGRVSGSVRSFSGEGVDVTMRGPAEDEQAQMSVMDAESRYQVETVSGRGASFSQAGGTTTAGVEHVEAQGIHAQGAALGGRDVRVTEVRVDGAQAQMGGDGSFSVDVANTQVDGVHVTEADGRQTADVGHIGLTDARVRGNTESGRIDQAHAGELVVQDISVNHDDMTASVDLVTVTDVNAQGIGADGTVERASVGSAQVEGVDARMTAADGTGAQTEVHADRLRADGIVGSVGEHGRYAGSVREVSGSGLRMDGDRTIGSGDPSMIDGRTSAGVDEFSLRGLRGQVSMEEQTAAGGWDSASVSGVRYGETDGSGQSLMDFRMSQATTGRASGQVSGWDGPAADMRFRGAVDDVHVESLDYSDPDQEAHVRGIDVERAYGATTSSGDIVAGARGVDVEALNYRRGEVDSDEMFLNAGAEGIHARTVDIGMSDGELTGVSADGARIREGEIDYRAAAADPNAPVEHTPMTTDFDFLRNTDGGGTVGGVPIVLEDGSIMRPSFNPFSDEDMVPVTDLEGLAEGAMDEDGHERSWWENNVQGPGTDYAIQNIGVDVYANDLGGGRIAFGDDFQGNVDRGGFAHVRGDDLGRSMRVDGGGIGASGLQIAGGEGTSIGHVGVGRFDAQIDNMRNGDARMRARASASDMSADTVRYGSRTREQQRRSRTMTGADRHVDLSGVPTEAVAAPERIPGTGSAGPTPGMPARRRRRRRGQPPAH